MRTLKMTTAQIREARLIRFNSDYIHDIDRARYLINSYYRLCGISNRLLELDNDYYYHDRPYTKELHIKEDKAVDRLRKNLNSYGLTLTFYSWLPTITDLNGYTAYEPISY